MVGTPVETRVVAAADVAVASATVAASITFKLAVPFAVLLRSVAVWCAVRKSSPPVFLWAFVFRRAAPSL